jgi:CheY-like chemotaxis protein
LPEEERNILLVDDKPENLLTLEAVLENLDCDLLKVTSVRETLRLVLKLEFDLILRDVQMPGIDGFEGAELLRDVLRHKVQVTLDYSR